MDDEVFVNHQYGYDIRMSYEKGRYRWPTRTSRRAQVAASEQIVGDQSIRLRRLRHRGAGVDQRVAEGRHTGSSSWDGYAAVVCDAGVKALTADGEVAMR